MFAVTLKSQQLGDVIYYVTGRGLAPSLMEPLSISASVGAGTSLLLPFRNPTDLPVLVDIHMSDNDTTLNSIAKSMLRFVLSLLACSFKVFSVSFKVERAL